MRGGRRSCGGSGVRSRGRCWGSGIASRESAGGDSDSTGADGRGAGTGVARAGTGWERALQKKFAGFGGMVRSSLVGLLLGGGPAVILVMRFLINCFFALHFVAAALLGQGQTPAAVGMSPATGSGLTGTFAFTFSDGDGVSDLNVLNILVNSALDAKRACYLAYVPATATAGTLLLVNDAGDVGGVLASMAIPGTGTISNGQCTITGTGSSSSGTGSTLTLSLNMTFAVAFGGNQLVYLAARDKVSNNSGWRTKGSWSVPPVPAMDPVVGAMTPGRSEAARQTYQFSFQDPTGAGNLGVLNVLVNSALDGNRACYVAYAANFSLLFLVKDVGGPSELLGPSSLGSAGVLENSQCAVNLATSSYTTNGNTATLTLDLTFKDSFAGDRVFYVAARSANELRNSKWQAKGTVGFLPVDGSANNLISFTPASATPGQTFTATVTAQGTNFVSGQVQASLGVGITVNSVSVTSPIALSLGVTVSPGAAGGPRRLIVTQGPNSYQLAGALTVQSTTSGPPLITSFTPASASPGTLVTVSGNNLGLGPQVSISAQGAGTLDVPVTAFDVGSLSFVVPPGAATGPIRVSVTGSAAVATSASNLTIVPSSSFTVTVDPPLLTLVRGHSAAYAITVNSANGFSQLADLTVSGLPAGITYTLSRRLLSAGQTAILTLSAPIGQALASTPLRISAAAAIDGFPVLSSAPVTVQVQAPTTSFVARTVVSDDAQTPIAGVTATLLGKNGNGGNTSCSGSARSDAAGNLLIANLPAGCAGAQLIGFDGLTATSPAGKYAGVNIVYTFTVGQATASPVLVHLPRIDDKETFLVTQNSPTDQSYSYRTIPGLSLTVYARTTLTMPDGSRPNPFPLVAVQVPVDRLPDAKPSVPTMVSAFIVAFQPANAKASQPVAVFYPNTIFTPPGTSMTMMTLDPTRGRMVPYGTGRVSANGLSIVPDLDPAYPGKRYGIVDFDWHGPMPPPPNGNNPGPGGGGTGNTGGGCSGGDRETCGGNPGGGDPVDIQSGLQIVKATDIAIVGNRGRIAIDRVYRSGSPNAGSFGVGMQFEYDWMLSAGNLSNLQAVNLISPDGNQFLMSRQANGTFTNVSLPFLRGALLSAGDGNNASLRWKNGTIYAFDAAPSGLPRLISITDRNSNKTTLVRSDRSPAQILSITDPVGRSLLLTWDASDRVALVRDPIGREVRYTYNAAGSLETVVDPAGGVTRYEYNSDGNMVRMFDQRGVKVFENTYEGPRVTQQILANGGVFKFSYGFLIVLPGGGGGGGVSIGPRPGEVTNQCLGFCSVTLVTDPLGRQTTYRFNAQGYLANVTDALGQKKIFERDPETNYLLSMRGNGQCPVCGPTGSGDLFYTYDANGNQISIRDALGNVSTSEYEPTFNNQTRYRNPLGQETFRQYDANGNLVAVVDSKNNRTSHSYNEFGLLRETTTPDARRSTFSHDAFGNLTSTTDPLGNVQRFQYDAISRVIRYTDRIGRIVASEFDSLDRLVLIRDPKGNVTKFTRDALGNIVEVIDANNNRTRFELDPMGRTVSNTTALGKTARWIYDLSGNPIKHTDRRGQTTDITYDALNRSVLEVYQDGSTVKRDYDQRGRVAKILDSTSGSFIYSYDVTGALESSSGPTGTVRYSRDPLARVSARHVAGQPSVVYTYDAIGNITKVESQFASAEFSFDSMRMKTSQSNSNGITSFYQGDAIGRIQSVDHRLGTASLFSQLLKLDPEGNLLDLLASPATTLLSTPLTSTFDVENRLLSRGSTRYTYDDEGNRLSENNGSRTIMFTWDTRGRLKSVADALGGTASFLYDPSGLMIQKRVTSGGSQSIERYLLDDATNVVWMSVNDRPVSILTGRAIDSHIASFGPGTPLSVFSADQRNSTVLITGPSGQTTGQISYEPFGAKASTTVSSPFSFTGRQETTSSITYHRHRHYDTQAGAFLSQDPIGLRGGDINRYRYVNNNPLISRDPNGLIDWACAAAGVLACTAGLFEGPGPCYLVRGYCAGKALNEYFTPEEPVVVPEGFNEQNPECRYCDPKPPNPDFFRCLSTCLTGNGPLCLGQRNDENCLKMCRPLK
jgi:RHS repeat-associated protein